ncbi:long-chain acyl-CoA synthetase [Sphingobium sp. AP50]|uniref:AMP-binding protein n=1 Tax=Sphingobium sp. AP50 TaxID=1884369 RepID=UPI0008D77B50|nr:AMP-binding protein [Sphingobium sp. AP50]SEK05708.1 long-chain acyl-CoA synthetase [Sphingobium sp. AP50]
MEEVRDRDHLDRQLDEASEIGMTLSIWAARQPDRPAVYDPSGRVLSFAELNAGANRLVRFLRHNGVQAGDALALICSNRAEFVIAVAATLRSGIRMTPVNWHLTADEIAYIVRDCDAKVVIGDARVGQVIKTAISTCPDVRVKIAVGGEIDGFVNFDHALALQDGSNISDPTLGNIMYYTSGTTGRPKGVLRASVRQTPASFYKAKGYDPETSVQLGAGPAYHGGPLGFDVRAAMNAGVPLIFLDKWDSELVLRTISERRVTHMHLVPIMFQRLLALPADVKAKYDVSHVRYIIHGAAPCSPEVKMAMIEWFGPVLTEYYAGSEGGAGFFITSEEWLRKPGSVGKRPPEPPVRILDGDGNELPVGESGMIYHKLQPGTEFRYHKDEQKTWANRVGDFFTLGDIGYFDEDDYLFLTGRSAETIISGGVNIYPQEIDNELVTHEAVADSATVGVPDAEWGEQVRGVVKLKAGFEASEELSTDIIAYLRARLPSYKVPKTIDFVTDLPRSEAGKIQRDKVRARYWEGRIRQI